MGRRAGAGAECPLHDHANGEVCDDDHGTASVMALSPLGDLVAMADAKGEVKLVDVDTGEQVM